MEEKKETIEVTEDVPKRDRIKRQNIVIKKLCNNRVVEKNVIQTTMVKVWRVSKLATFTEVGKNTFIITFETITDK